MPTYPVHHFVLRISGARTGLITTTISTRGMFWYADSEIPLTTSSSLYL